MYHGMKIRRRYLVTWSDLGMLTLIVGALALFAGVLGWASWAETRSRRRKEAG
jgi:hypothetical protein